MEVVKELKSNSHPEFSSGSELKQIPKQVRNGEGSVQIVAVEQDKRSVDYRKLTKKIVSFPCAIVVGHETKGVSKKVLKEADVIVELPMLGINKSFNVWGTAAVVAYKILESI